MKKTSRNASSVVNGFDFQIYAGIYLMLRHMSRFDELKIEGEDQDIEIKLLDGSTLYAQVKSFQKPYDQKTFKRKTKVKEALNSLKDVECNDSDQLIYVSNAPGDLFGSGTSEFDHMPYYVRYDDLSFKSQKCLSDIVAEEKAEIDKSRLVFCAIKFVGSDKSERTIMVEEKLRDFLSSTGIQLKNFSSDILDKWFANLSYIASSNSTKKLSKEDVKWSLVLFELKDTEGREKAMMELIDAEELDFQEALSRYIDIIRMEELCFESHYFIIREYDDYQFEGRNSEKMRAYITQNAKHLSKEIFGESPAMGNDIAIVCAQIIAYMVLIRKYQIKRIEEGLATYEN